MYNAQTQSVIGSCDPQLMCLEPGREDSIEVLMSGGARGVTLPIVGRRLVACD